MITLFLLFLHSVYDIAGGYERCKEKFLINQIKCTKSNKYYKSSNKIKWGNPISELLTLILNIIQSKFTSNRNVNT
jgi:hypothetical protein